MLRTGGFVAFMSTLKLIVLNKLAAIDLNGTPMADLENPWGLLRIGVGHRERMDRGADEVKVRVRESFTRIHACSAAHSIK